MTENTNTLIEKLSTAEIAEIRNGIIHAARFYNIPGVTEDTRIEAIEENNNFAAISQVGGNITSLELGGEDIYFSGQNPYVIPAIDKKGKLTFNSPEFYRFIGHRIIPAANKFEGVNEEAHSNLEEITGLELPKNYDTGHHGISQCRIGQISKNNGIIKYEITHQPDKANLFETLETMEAGFDGEWFREEITITNPNNFPIPVSLLRHPYLVVPAGSFDKASIKVVTQTEDGDVKEPLFNLSDYEKLGEQRFDGIPLLKDSQFLEFDRGDGVVLQIAFDGDYDQNGAGIQLFSNGFSEEKISQDYIEKHKIHQRRLRETAELLRAVGLNGDWYSKKALENEMKLHNEMLSSTRSICIEDNTSRGNIYTNINSNPVILQQGQSAKFVRMTRRVQ